MVLIKFVQRFEPRDRCLVYRKLPRHIFTGLSRRVLLSGPARLSPTTILMSALRSTLLPRCGLRAATMIRRVLARVSAAWTLGAAPVLRYHTTPRIFTLWLRSLIEWAVSTARHAFVNDVITRRSTGHWIRLLNMNDRYPCLATDTSSDTFSV